MTWKSELSAYAAYLYPLTLLVISILPKFIVPAYDVAIMSIYNWYIWPYTTYDKKL